MEFNNDLGYTMLSLMQKKKCKILSNYILTTTTNSTKVWMNKN